MGTEFTLRVWAEPEQQSDAKAAVAEAFARIAALEMVFSDYEVDSEIVRLTTHPPGEPVTEA